VTVRIRLETALKPSRPRLGHGVAEAAPSIYYRWASPLIEIPARIESGEEVFDEMAATPVKTVLLLCARLDRLTM
jgi:hypothetical protein